MFKYISISIKVILDLIVYIIYLGSIAEVVPGTVAGSVRAFNVNLGRILSPGINLNLFLI